MILKIMQRTSTCSSLYFSVLTFCYICFIILSSGRRTYYFFLNFWENVVAKIPVFLNASVCPSWKQGHSFILCKHNDQNQKINIDIIILLNLSALLKFHQLSQWWPLEQKEQRILAQGHKQYLVGVSLVSFNLDPFLSFSWLWGVQASFL